MAVNAAGVEAPGVGKVARGAGNKTVVDFVCVANLGRSDGGQETWAYQFIPALLARHPELVMRVYGQRLEGKSDTTADLKAAVGEAAPRLSVRFFPARRRRWPLFLSMLGQFAQWKRHEANPAADISISVGSVVELLIVLCSRPARAAFRMVWLRTIFVDQKAFRIPRPLRGLARQVEARILARADLILANGEDIASYYRRYGLDVTVIKNAVELSNWDMPLPSLVEPIHVAYVGRLSVEKGIVEFLDLARLFKGSADSNAFVFHLLGDVGHEQLARESAARGDIVWHGGVAREELQALLARMDVCVAFTFASAERGGGGTSNAMMEQLAARRVLLAWDNAIFRQWLDETNAYLVPQGDVHAAAVALREIRRHPDEARRRAEAGRATVAEFDVPAMMTRFDEQMALALRQRRVEA